MAVTIVIPTWLLILSGVLALALAFYFLKPHRVDKEQRGYKVVVTGSSKGIGYALADEFLRLGDSVVVTSRSKDAVDRALKELGEKYGRERVHGVVSDVSSQSSMDSLAAEAEKAMGGVDIWVNNAGCSQEPKASVADTSEDILRKVMNTNALGMLLATGAAIRVMRKHNKGDIFNMEGAGSNGMATPTFAVYGYTKAGLVQLLKSLLKETKGTGIGVHNISPGMVLTDLLLAGTKDLRTLQFFNILAERPTTVAEWLVPRIRGACGGRPGQCIRFLTTPGVIWRFATSPFRRNRFFDCTEQGGGRLKQE